MSIVAGASAPIPVASSGLGTTTNDYVALAQMVEKISKQLRAVKNGSLSYAHVGYIPIPPLQHASAVQFGHAKMNDLRADYGRFCRIRERTRVLGCEEIEKELQSRVTQNCNTDLLAGLLRSLKA
jgi:hypothetical protein